MFTNAIGSVCGTLALGAIAALNFGGGSTDATPAATSTATPVVAHTATAKATAKTEAAKAPSKVDYVNGRFTITDDPETSKGWACLTGDMSPKLWELKQLVFANKPVTHIISFDDATGHYVLDPLTGDTPDGEGWCVYDPSNIHQFNGAMIQTRQELALTDGIEDTDVANVVYDNITPGGANVWAVTDDNGRYVFADEDQAREYAESTGGSVAPAFMSK